ncbi:hypothetical protein ACET3Z_013593 [Daucus carota]
MSCFNGSWNKCKEKLFRLNVDQKTLISWFCQMASLSELNFCLGVSVYRSQALRGVILWSEDNESIDSYSKAVDASSVDVVTQASSEVSSDIVDEVVPSGHDHKNSLICSFTITRKYQRGISRTSGSRWTRLRRVREFFSRIEKDIRFSYFWTRFCKLISVTVLAVHLAACFYYWLAFQHKVPAETWIGHHLEDFKEKGIWVLIKRILQRSSSTHGWLSAMSRDYLLVQVESSTGSSWGSLQL